MRFFFFGLDDASGTLTALSRTLQSGSNDNVLWLRENLTSYSWQRAEVTFTSLLNSKVSEDVDDRDMRITTEIWSSF